MSKIPTRDEALGLLKKYNDSDSLVRHGMAVEAVMKHFAEKMGEDPEKWGIIGLVHDLDYEKYPEQHCTMTRQILEEQEWPEEYIRAIMSHAWGMCTDDKPELPMEKVLYATDELTGLITAAVYVRPSRSILDLTVKSVKKKWKTKSFAAGANREVIMQGAEMLGMPLEELMAETIAGMQKEADALGLRGEL
ncbi:HDIG domain-containing metalloprotein [Prolixibacter sp. SD074]|jgi:putative nucleotidyltransferase with HDIG domain|uniref:HDIG domain-containing metalloprotein n=1 Tax=Prolixibacter sp. SD074 TaxID=2652391 RepID=UPI00127CEE1D|nr:HDIG domain-containing metalloprotein [Prolixibacter sp. SD074]GET29122.1 HDIG domain-containing protein [Prolixibacter sp. SD074]